MPIDWKSQESYQRLLAALVAASDNNVSLCLCLPFTFMKDTVTDRCKLPRRLTTKRSRSTLVKAPRTTPSKADSALRSAWPTLLRLRPRRRAAQCPLPDPRARPARLASPKRSPASWVSTPHSSRAFLPRTNLLQWFSLVASRSRRPRSVALLPRSSRSRKRPAPLIVTTLRPASSKLESTWTPMSTPTSTASTLRLIPASSAATMTRKCELKAGS